MSDVSCLNSTLPRCGYASSTSAAVGGADEIGLEADTRRRGSGTDSFNSARSSRRMFPGGIYLDRAAPRLAPAKFLLPIFTAGLFIEPAPGSNCPGRILSSCPSALASRFPVFRAAFAFARWRALALVMSSSPFKGVSGPSSPLPQGPHYTPTSAALASDKLRQCNVPACRVRCSPEAMSSSRQVQVLSREPVATATGAASRPARNVLRIFGIACPHPGASSRPMGTRCQPWTTGTATSLRRKAGIVHGGS